jgi:UDP-N-acetylmuramyl tripeptide synthase
MRFLVTLWIAKIGYALIRFFGRGAGYTWPGHIALKLYPSILGSRRVHFADGVIMVTGTNGKTTTAKLARHIIESHGQTALGNETGGNIVNGIVSSILLQMSWGGKLPATRAVFEVDEFALPHVMKHLTPDVLVLLNLSRDQLDRFGETDTIVQRWIAPVMALPEESTLVLYKEQEEFEKLEGAACKTVFFSTDDDISQHLAVKGEFNRKNAHAAVLATRAIGFNDRDCTQAALMTFRSAYGRGEVIEHEGLQCHVFLAKNPASFNHNVELLREFDPATTALWFVLNDNIPDGRDVSWIYDVESEPLRSAAEPYTNFAVSGTRGIDMAIRLNYAGLELTEAHIHNTHAEALKQLQASSAKQILIFPNYSAMLEVRKLLTGKSIL